MNRGRRRDSRTFSSSGRPRSPHRFPDDWLQVTLSSAALLVACAVPCILVAGCASPKADSDGPRPREGIAEYRRVTVEAANAMRAALKTLASVSTQSNVCSPRVLQAFSAQMQRLQVDSLSLRVRAQVMQARGDAYFENWDAHVHRVNDPGVRVMAEQRRPLFEDSFQHIKGLTQEAREAFAPCVGSLRKLQTKLESDPASLNAVSTRELIANGKQNGEHVQRCLAGIVSELDLMRALLPKTDKGA
jgi:hypothetical protein